MDKTFTITVTQLADKNIALNGGFESYKSTSKIPKSWKAAKFGASDGKSSTHKSGKFSVTIVSAGTSKTLSQTLTLSGMPGDPLTLQYSAKGSAVVSSGTCQVQVSFFNGTISVGSKTLKCPKGTTFNWKTAKLNFTAPATYTKIVIKFTVKKTGGTLWFDNVSLKR